jgi:hypothetical protein
VSLVIVEWCCVQIHRYRSSLCVLDENRLVVGSFFVVNAFQEGAAFVSRVALFGLGAWCAYDLLSFFAGYGLSRLVE